jgi:hypothetical protein
MAETYPRDLNADEVKSRGEGAVFHSLRGGLADRWSVFHAVSFVMRDPAEGAQDAEIDFVLCHPDKGILCVEVKGGSVECEFGEWYFLMDGSRVRIKDPFLQAIDHRHVLGRYLKQQRCAEASGWLIGHAVALPDVTLHELSLPPHAPREIILDRNDLKQPEAAIDRVLAFHRGAREKRSGPGSAGAAVLRNLLRPDFSPQERLADHLVDDELELVLLTQEQANALSKMTINNRLAVIGCAGSGKTLLAVEHARRLAAGGSAALFVCFNKGLARQLRERHEAIGVDFFTFHGLCVEQARLAGIELPDYGDEKPPNRYWNELLPEALLDAIAKRGPQYDALVVDEAQDLHQDWYSSLLLLLKDEHKADIWLFFDANQRIFDSGMSPPEGFAKYPLTVNCRNTQAIHRAALRHYKGAIQPDVCGPEGRPVERVSAEDPVDAVARIVKRLCAQEEIAPQDVVILSGHGVEKSRVYNEWSDGPYELTRETEAAGKKIFFSSIRGFKGLEARVVILCELESLHADSREQQLYVGISRGRTHCIIVESPSSAQEAVDAVTDRGQGTIAV